MAEPRVEAKLLREMLLEMQQEARVTRTRPIGSSFLAYLVSDQEEAHSREA
jgi:hypothetical protein